MKKTIIALTISLAALLFLGMMPVPVFAAPQSGDIATTDYVDTLMGSDGREYYRTGAQTSFQYLSDGTTKKFRHVNYSEARRHYLIKFADQQKYYGYCIEQGISFPDSQEYKGNGYIKDNYFRNLPSAVRTGIMLTTIFGRQPGKNVPVAGCNEDDWYWATQVILWEYQQKLRTSPTSIKSNGLVPSDYFYSTLKGRPAEKCYRHMLKEMGNYTKIPSFTSRTASAARTEILHWNSKKGLWETTLKDANKLNVALRLIKGKITILKEGNSYTLQTKTKMPLTTLAFQKNTKLPSHELLIWGAGTSSQALVTGSADPISFFLKVRTEESGRMELLKTSEDGKKSGFTFTMTDKSGTAYTGTTDETGRWRISLPAGAYTLAEEKTPTYQPFKQILVSIKEKQTTKIEVNNNLEKGRIALEKNFINKIDNSTGKESEAVFQVYSSKYDNYDAAPSLWRDQIVTDQNGIAKTCELPLGEYIIHQTAAKQNLTISDDIKVNISTDNPIVKLQALNIQQRGRFLLKKVENGSEKRDQKGLTGATFDIRAAEDLHGPDGGLLVKKGAIVETVVTNEKGMAYSKWLYPGRYEIIETKPPKGFTMPHNPVAEILLGSHNRNETTFTKEIVIKNDKMVVVPQTGDASHEFPDGWRIATILSLLMIALIQLAFPMKRKSNR